MSVRKDTISLDVNVTVVERSKDYFAATTHPFAITVYSKTKEDAEKRALDAVYFLLKQYSTSTFDLTSYLNRRRVKHTVAQSVPLAREPKVVHECQQELRVKVPA